jgi:hypothetical protein
MTILPLGDNNRRTMDKERQRKTQRERERERNCHNKENRRDTLFIGLASIARLLSTT